MINSNPCIDYTDLTDREYTNKTSADILKRAKKTKVSDVKVRSRIVSIRRKLASQFESHGDPFRSLMLEVVMQAVDDVALNNADARLNKDSASEYLRSTMPHADICNVSSEWIRKVLDKYKIRY